MDFIVIFMHGKFYSCLNEASEAEEELSLRAIYLTEKNYHEKDLEYLQSARIRCHCCVTK